MTTPREANILAESRIAIGSDPDVRLFRNNVGVFRRMYTEEKVRCGLCPGSGDLIGWRTIEVTPDMVGQRIAVFISAEAKAPYGPTNPEQAQFIKVVRDMGGRAGIFRTPSELRELTLGQITNGSKRTRGKAVRKP
jgi:NAD dependent epimerase/dehydratase family enzyme